jgi:hypothetical protein
VFATYDSDNAPACCISENLSGMRLEPLRSKALTLPARVLVSHSACYQNYTDVHHADLSKYSPEVYADMIAQGEDKHTMLVVYVDLRQFTCAVAT